ncbi:MAG: hypothetical protein PHT40_01010 [Patescibacteria group bacterium]|nr:hypothetical protein [Patescibacteria group bacterium]
MERKKRYYVYDSRHKIVRLFTTRYLYHTTIISQNPLPESKHNYPNLLEKSAYGKIATYDRRKIAVNDGCFIPGKSFLVSTSTNLNGTPLEIKKICSKIPWRVKHYIEERENENWWLWFLSDKSWLFARIRYTALAKNLC